MRKKEIFIGTIEKVKEFVDLASKIDGEVYLKSGNYVVDAKSILGVFSINLTVPVIIEYPYDTPGITPFELILETRFYAKDVIE